MWYACHPYVTLMSSLSYQVYNLPLFSDAWLLINQNTSKTSLCQLSTKNSSGRRTLIHLCSSNKNKNDILCRRSYLLEFNIIPVAIRTSTLIINLNYSGEKLANADKDFVEKMKPVAFVIQVTSVIDLSQNMPEKVKVHVYCLISNLNIYQPTLHFIPWSMDLFICVPFRLDGEHSVLQLLRLS